MWPSYNVVCSTSKSVWMELLAGYKSVHQRERAYVLKRRRPHRLLPSPPYQWTFLPTAYGVYRERYPLQNHRIHRPSAISNSSLSALIQENHTKHASPHQFQAIYFANSRSWATVSSCCYLGCNNGCAGTVVADWI